MPGLESCGAGPNLKRGEVHVVAVPDSAVSESARTAARKGLGGPGRSRSKQRDGVAEQSWLEVARRGDHERRDAYKILHTTAQGTARDTSDTRRQPHVVASARHETVDSMGASLFFSLTLSRPIGHIIIMPLSIPCSSILTTHAMHSFPLHPSSSESGRSPRASKCDVKFPHMHSRREPYCFACYMYSRPIYSVVSMASVSACLLALRSALNASMRAFRSVSVESAVSIGPEAHPARQTYLGSRLRSSAARG